MDRAGLDDEGDAGVMELERGEKEKRINDGKRDERKEWEEREREGVVKERDETR